MQKLIVFFTTISILFICSWTSSAQTPPEVLKPYKEYKEAIKQNDFSTASKKALVAWEASERVLGEHSTTGDLALNFALMAPSMVTAKDNRNRKRAFNRAIELGRLSPERPIDVILDRHLEYLEYLNSTRENNGFSFEEIIQVSDFLFMEKALNKYHKTNSWHEAVMEAIRTEYHYKSADYESAVESGMKSLRIFKNDPYPEKSPYQYEATLNVGRSLFELGRHLDAGVILQENLDSKNSDSASKKFKSRSEAIWELNWLELYKEGALPEAYKNGLCDCMDKDALLNRPKPIKRIPPVFPARAEESGEAVIVFNVASHGIPENIQIVGYTHKRFGKAASEAAKKFVYTPAIDGTDFSKRKNIPARILFTLRNDKNEIIPPEPMQFFDSLKINHDMIDDDNTLIVSAQRLRRR